MAYDQAQEIAKGIYWVGYHHEKSGLHSNPYLVVEDEEAVLIDAGSRPDFSSVVVKILDAGINPVQISRLIYHHYDPDLCGSISNFENLIDNPQLEIISQTMNNIFIDHYSTSVKKRCINELKNRWAFRSGRTLQFINTPYSHSPGSFVTYDRESRVLFTSDIFGTFSKVWQLVYEPKEDCTTCTDYLGSGQTRHEHCYFTGLKNFHETIMTSKKALDHTLDILEQLDIEILAPQHGSVVIGREHVKTVFQKLRAVDKIGIDRVLELGQVY